MSSDLDEEFPSRPFSIDEALSLRNRVPSVAHTAPTIGLESRARGQATDAHSVVGLYVGITNGGYYYGFNRETESWESVSVCSYEGTPTGADLAGPLDELMQWLTQRYPDEEFVAYDPNDPAMN
jgi:hypothetical protein